MPRVTHVKSARKNNPVCKKGESYYWWKFRYGGKRYSLTQPRASQLTNSPYYSTVRSLCEQIEDWESTEPDDLDSLRDDLASELENLGSECQDSLDNMPESLQTSPTGELLNERIDACTTGQDELQGLDISFSSELDEKVNSDEERETEIEEWISSLKDEMTDAVSSCEV